MPNLPSQLGLTYAVMPGVSAHTRTIFSNRMGTTQREALALVVRRSRNALTYTINEIDRILAGIAAQPDAAPARHSALDPRSFIDHFKTYFNVEVQTNRELTTLLRQFRATCVLIQDGLNEHLDIVDLPIMMQGGGTAGYVARYAGPPVRRGRIHLDFGRLVRGREWVAAETLVHEASHKFANTRDHGYVMTPMAMLALDTNQAMTNADSVARVIVLPYMISQGG